MQLEFTDPPPAEGCIDTQVIDGQILLIGINRPAKRNGWTPRMFRELAAAYTQASGKPWTMPVGFKHSLFEVAIAAFKASEGKGAKALRDALRNTDLDTIVGHVNFRNGPVPSISKTPLVGGQWQKKGDGLELVIVENGMANMVPVGAELKPLA